MKLQVIQENLNKALNSVARTASSRATLPILSNVLIKTVKNRLSISATNLDIAVTHYIGAKVIEEGSITIPARLTQDFISNLPNEPVELELEDKKLHINSKMYQSTINGVSAEEFPVMPAIEKGVIFKVSTKELKHGLQQVVFAASNDEARPVLTGVNLSTHEGKLYAVATDSYRLAEKNLGVNTEDINILVPATAIADLLRIVTDLEGEATITYDEQQVCFRVGDIELIARLLEGTYPNYRQIIPAKFSTTVEVTKSELASITKVSALFARESAGSITINVSEKNQEISIHSIATQLGENTANAKAKVKGDGSVTLNSRYLIDALSALEGDEVKLSFNGKLDAILLSGASKKSDYIHIIMPLKS
jgi:DNA polymerase-3 subunit beta